MDKHLYVMLMEDINPLNSGIVEQHVGHLASLDSAGKLVLCGPFSDYSGGIVVLRAGSAGEAHELCKADPFISEGYKSYTLRTLEVASESNGYLLG